VHENELDSHHVEPGISTQQKMLQSITQCRIKLHEHRTVEGVDTLLTNTLKAPQGAVVFESMLQ